MSNDKMREEFEAWLFEFLNNADMEDIAKARAEQNGQSIYLFEDDEATMSITAMWVAWHASRAALVVELPEQSPETPFSKHMVMDSSSVIEAIEAAGIKIKE